MPSTSIPIPRSSCNDSASHCSRRATIITFVNPAVAVLLGIVILSEPLTWGVAVGFPLVLLGSYLSTRPTTSREAEESAAETAHA